uniref:Microtubule-associated protein n=1 Tax=Oncorhynchus kisutch TaxID=8019 RepID=A0A8C7JHF3_ONCKI
MDLSLHDALTDGAPKSGPDSLVRRDFMASLEKETFDDKVGETVGKTDYRPLLDGKDGKGSSMMPGGQMGTRMQWQEPMGEKHPCPTGQQSAVNSDYLSGPVSSMMGIPGDQWGNQNKGMKDSNIPDSLMGFSQPGMMNMNMGSGGMGGMAPFQTGMPPMGNSQKASPLFASEPHKQSQSQAPFKPNDSYPSAPGHNTQSQDNSAVKEENKDKQEKADFFPKMDNLNMFDKTEKSDKMENKEKKDQSKKVNADKTNKSEILKDEEKIDKTEKNVKNEKVDKPEKTNKDEKMEKKENGEKTDKMVKVEKNEKAGKGTAKSPTTIRSKQDLTSPDSKAKPAVGSTKPNSFKTRPTSLSTGDAAAPLKRSAPTSSSANKKSHVTKATTPTAGTKRPTVAPSQTPTASKSKTPENGTSDRRPPVPKANGTANKDSSSTTTTTKPAGPRPSANVPSLRRNTVPKTDIKPGDLKKPTTLKTTPAKPRVPHTSATAPSTPATNGEQPRRRITKPPVPKQTAMERKPAVPRAPRTPRPINAPLPDLKNVRSKIGSTDNMKYQSTGGKVSSAGGSQSKDGQGKVMIVHKKLDFSHITSRCGSKDNIKHVPGGGNVQIQHKKVDLSKVTSKCGSKDNIKHKPGVSTTGGGDVKIEAKANGNGKPKVGSMDNIGLEAEDVQNKAGGMQEKDEEKTSPPGGPPATGARSMAKENGHKEATPHPNPFGGDGLRDPIGMGMDKRIPETN